MEATPSTPASSDSAGRSILRQELDKVSRPVGLLWPPAQLRVGPAFLVVPSSSGRISRLLLGLCGCGRVHQGAAEPVGPGWATAAGGEAGGEGLQGSAGRCQA